MTQLNRFNTEFQALLHPQNPEAYSMMVFIRSRLRQFGLQRAFSEAEILSDVYVRAIKFLQAGGTIKNPQPWIRATSFNVVRELSRSSIRDRDRLFALETLGEQEIPDQSYKDSLGQAELDHNLEKILLAFRQLEPREQEILRQRIVEKRSWQEIAQSPVLPGEPTASVATLRQQGHRTLLKLRRLFHQL